MPAPRTVLHLHTPLFACAVAEASNGQIRGRPFAVVSAGHPRGVVIEPSHTAGLMGVRAGMTVAELRRWREVTLIPPDAEAMRFAQTALVKLAGRYSPLVEDVSLGSLALDLTGTTRLWGPAQDAAQLVLRHVQSEAGFICTAGIAGGKFASHAASRVAIPSEPAQVPQGGERDFLAPLPVGVLPGVGLVMKKQLMDLGVERVAQYQALPSEVVQLCFGQMGIRLLDLAQGFDNDPVTPAGALPRVVRESLAPDPDTNSFDALRGCLALLCERGGLRLMALSRVARSMTVVVVYTDGEVAQRRQRIPVPAAHEAILYPQALGLLEGVLKRRVRVRRLTLVLEGLSQDYWQESLFPDTVDRLNNLGYALQHLRKRFGDHAVRLGAAWRVQG